MASTASSKLSDQLEQIVMGRIEADKLTLPTMPVMALKAIELLRNPDFSMREVGLLIAKDPILAAQVLRLSNSAGLAAREPCRNIDQATARLGAQKLRLVLHEASARRMFDSRDPKIADAANKVWDHSRAVAMVAQDVSVLAAIPDPDAAYLGGLLHDIGKPIIATMLLETENQMAQRNLKGWIDSQDWLAVIQKTHRKIGVALSRKWQLSDEVCAAIAQAGDYDAVNRLTTGNAIRFANALVKQQGVYEAPVDPQETEALIMVGQSLLNVDDEAIERLTKNLKARTRERAA